MLALLWTTGDPVVPSSWLYAMVLHYWVSMTAPRTPGNKGGLKTSKIGLEKSEEGLQKLECIEKHGVGK